MTYVLTFIVIASIISIAALTAISNNLQSATYNNDREEALNIAEAGINYYLWHLTHNPIDFKDGQSTPSSPVVGLGYGPYVHNYLDISNKDIGSYTLYINPSGNNGSTIVTVRSTGRVIGSSVSRTVVAEIGAPSFASYVVNSDSALWFGNTETANGPAHSNTGIRMDGPNTTDVTSSSATYVPPYELGGDGQSHPGVWCSTSVTYPVNCSTRNKSDWQYPVATVNFNQITSSLCNIKKTAFAANSATASLATQPNACSQTPTTRTSTYIPERSISYSATRGYMIELNSNDTYNLYDVNGENDQKRPYTSALSLALVASNVAIDPSGIIYVEDNVWVRTNPTFNGRVSIASGRLTGNNNAFITIVDQMLYSAKDGSVAIGLVAQGDVLLAPYAPPASGSFNFEVDAAIISESGNVEYPVYYKTNPYMCTYGWISPNQTFTFYGSVSTRLNWTWTWLIGGSCGNAVYSSSQGYYISGILNNTTSYDYNLLYSPPPSFPVTSAYNILSWREVLSGP